MAERVSLQHVLAGPADEDVLVDEVPHRGWIDVHAGRDRREGVDVDPRPRRGGDAQEVLRGLAKPPHPREQDVLDRRWQARGRPNSDELLGEIGIALGPLGDPGEQRRLGLAAEDPRELFGQLVAIERAEVDPLDPR